MENETKVGSDETAVEEPLAPFLDTEFILFIHNKIILQVVRSIMETLLKFTKVTVLDPGKTKKESIEKLAKTIMTKDANVLVLPSMKIKNHDMETKIDLWNDFLVNVKTRVEQTKNDKEKTLNCMSKIAGVLVEAENYLIREKYIRMFASYRIPSVFIFSIFQSEKIQDKIKEWHPILEDYLIEHLSNKGSAIEKIKEKESEIELSKRKAEADKLIAEGQKHKGNRNFKEAVDCFEKAIRIYPDDPHAYIESGKGFTKLKKYNRALARFSEAEEIARDLPTPNMEIGNVKVIQAKELMESGADPDSKEVTQLLDEASSSYKSALDKAEDLQPLTPEDETDRGAEAVSAIARSISEQGLSENFGAGHPSVKKFTSLVGEAMKKKGIQDADKISTPDRITLGLVAADDGEFEDSEKYLFEAVEDKKYFSDACWGINYLGAQVRQSGDVEMAFKIYYRLLTFNPPNKAAIHFNLAVAWRKKENDIEASGEIAQAVYTDPGLVHDEMFHKNAGIMKLFKELLSIFKKTVENAKTMKPDKVETAPEAKPMFAPEPNKEFETYKNRFEGLVKKDRQAAIKALYEFMQRKVDFFFSAEIYSSYFIMDIIKETYGRMKSVENPKAQKFAGFLGEVVEKEKQLALPSTPRFSALREKFEGIIETNRQGANRKLYDFTIAAPGFFASVEVYGSELIMDLIEEAHEKYKDQANSKIKKFVEFLETVIERKKQFTPAAGVANGFLQELKKLISSKQTEKAIDFLQEHIGEPDLMDKPDIYEDESVMEFASEVRRKFLTAEDEDKKNLAGSLTQYLENREKFGLFKSLVDQGFEIYMQTMDQRQMVNYVTKAIVSFPECVDKAFFYENSELVNAAYEIHKKLSGKGVGDEYKA